MQVSTFIEACQEQIDIIKNSIKNEEANSKGWLGVRAVLDNTNADTIAHVVCFFFFFFFFLIFTKSIYLLLELCWVWTDLPF